VISIIIPARNERFLQKTIEDIGQRASHEYEIIAVLDGYWPDPPLKDSPNLRIIHFGKPVGMRSCINAAVAIARYKYILKCDAHVMFASNFDASLINCSRPKRVQVPTRKRLDPDKWALMRDGRPPVNCMYLDKDNRGRIDKKLNGVVAMTSDYLFEIEAFQGSCWFMEKAYFEHLGLEDDVNFGGSGHEAQEIYYKVHFDGGQVMRNRNTWYAHWHKDKRGFKLDSAEVQKSRDYLPVMIKELEASVAEKDKDVAVENEDYEVELPKARTGRGGLRVNPALEYVMNNFSKRPHWDQQVSPKRLKGFNRRHMAEMMGDIGFKVGVEVGVAQGLFSEVLCKSIPDLELYCVDPWEVVPGEIRTIKVGNKIASQRYEEAQERLSPYNATLIKKPSIDAILEDFDDNSLDFVYIDGSHQFDYVMTDLILWNTKVKTGGIIAGHDYYRFRNAGVVDAVDVFTKMHGIHDWYITGERTPTFFWIKHDEQLKFIAPRYIKEHV
jgi:glycosyltransferase involved in cell wall biosynthesis